MARQATLKPATLAEHFGAYLRTLRRSRRLSQVETCARLAISQTHLSGLERGRGWTVDTFCAVFVRLGASPADVFATCWARVQSASDLPLFAGSADPAGEV